MFKLYSDPQWILVLLTVLSLSLSFLVWLTPLLIVRNYYCFVNKKTVSIFYVFFAALLLVNINYIFNFQNIWTICLSYLLVCLIIYKSTLKKSLKWINIFLLLLILIILTTYTFMNYKLLRVTYAFFNFNDITDFTFNMKPYLTLYKIDDFLGDVSFSIDGENITIKNDSLLIRLFGVYTALNCITFFIWLWIYHVITRTHGFSHKN